MIIITWNVPFSLITGRTYGIGANVAATAKLVEKWRTFKRSKITWVTVLKGIIAYIYPKTGYTLIKKKVNRLFFGTEGQTRTNSVAFNWHSISKRLVIADESIPYFLKQQM